MIVNGFTWMLRGGQPAINCSAFLTTGSIPTDRVLNRIPTGICLSGFGMSGYLNASSWGLACEQRDAIDRSWLSKQPNAVQRLATLWLAFTRRIWVHCQLRAVYLHVPTAWIGDHVYPTLFPRFSHHPHVRHSYTVKLTNYRGRTLTCKTLSSFRTAQNGISSSKSIGGSLLALLWGLLPPLYCWWFWGWFDCPQPFENCESSRRAPIICMVPPWLTIISVV